MEGGGSLTEVRTGRGQDFDRVVFDFGSGALPRYTVSQAASFVATSGRTVPVQGNAHLAVRFDGAGSMGSYRGPNALTPGREMVREVKLVDDFEGIMVWGIGLERHSCPRVSLLASPTRLVVDIPR